MAKRRPIDNLTGKQRRHLRGLGHGLDPIVQVGHQGLTDAVAEAIDEALEHHELIKVRIGKNAPDPDRDGVAGDLAGRLGCHVVQSLGRVVLLFREAEDAEDRKIRLPRFKVAADQSDIDPDSEEDGEAQDDPAADVDP